MPKPRKKSKVRPTPSKKAKRPKKPKKLTPDEIAKAVRVQIVPTLSAIGIVAHNHLFADRIERLAATLALWGPKVNLTAHPEDPTR